MIGYRIEIQGNANGEIWFNVSFLSGELGIEVRKFNNAEIAFIHSTVKKLTDALKSVSANFEAS